jgi:sulfur transfer complex TusBCD TusB component (DsrH family)
VLRLTDGTQVRCVVDAQHAAQLTREHVTSAVHYVTFELSPAQVAAFGEGVVLAIDHPAYIEEAELAPATVAELRADLRGE